MKNKPTYNAYEEDITIVNFYFDKSTILQFTRQQSMTVVDYISQLGGLLGLFLGFSFISGVELFYWLTIRLGKNIRQWFLAFSANYPFYVFENLSTYP